MTRTCTPWTIDFSCCDALTRLPADEEEADALKSKAADAAYSALNAATGGLYEQCTVDLRLCSPCSCRTTSCSDCMPARVDLFDYVSGPIISIAEIKTTDADGVETTLDDSTYGFYGGRYLVPFVDMTPSLCTLLSQRLDVPYGADGYQTTVVTVNTGLPLEAMLQTAANDLACQILSWCLHLPCDIPSNAITWGNDGIVIKLETGLNAIATVKMALALFGADKRRISRMIDPTKYVGAVSY